MRHLNETLFLGLDQAREAVARWVADYNQHCPVSALGYATPAAYAAQLTAMGEPLRATEPLRGSPIAPSARERHADRRTLASRGEYRGSQHGSGWLSQSHPTEHPDDRPSYTTHRDMTSSSGPASASGACPGPSNLAP
ncbi:hypothetical protein LNKW23_37790 [Paralimibaculum aggregatum]|uniref:Integrase catalytic domain-containing protein n=1 Tax=Paralimibaculum aggregatum TaxID=3036245 RepID=A0ABQ6LRT1_9RHOB|nr:hypothetical protein LNKW23_37790 [Limibaculum sp. NKW23]